MNKFSFIVPVTKRDGKYLKRCLLSLQEQDYPNKEIIVVGHRDKKSQKICKQLNVSYYDIDKDTAPAKRNYGFDKSTGDIVFFFDCDCTLLSGMLRLISDTFEDNNCDFVYGAYRWNVESLNTFPSRPFDPYLLETSNYISTMSPMKREIFPRFREDLEYFQDWDLFLRIVKKGYRGHFIRDVIFITELQDNKSISGNPKHNYLDKVNHIKRINNIPQRDICVCTLGAPYQAIQRAKILNADYFGAHQNTTLVQSPSLFKHQYKMIYVMGFYPLTINDHAQLFANAPKDCLKVIQWIGTDVYQLRTRFNWESIKYIRDKILKHIDVQLCNSEELEKELGELAIKAHKVYMPIVGTFEITPLPEKFTVGVYYSASNPMHNEEFLIDVAKSMPDIEFKFFGGAKRGKEENIEYMEWVDIKEVIKQCSINVRITVHDGFPQIPIQFMLSGRQAITNFDLPWAEHIDLQLNKENYAKSKIELIEKIREVKKKPDPTKIEGARGYYKEILDPEGYKKIIYMILEKGKEWIFKDGELCD